MTAHRRPMRSARLVQFTDPHLLPDPRGSLRGVCTLPRLEACVAHARRHFFPADAVLLTGDIVHDEPAAYELVAAVFGGFDCPVWPIAGNHDLPEDMRRRLDRPPFRFGREFATGDDWQVVLLESWDSGLSDGSGRLGAAELADLDHSLAASDAPHALVVLHHPPIAMDAPALDALGLLDAADLRATLARHPRVRGICWGHAHQALDVYVPNGVRLMGTPATSMQFKPRRPTFEADDRPPGYRVIDLQADGAIASEVVWLEGYRDGN